MNHKKIDAISDTMRIIYESAENNMVKEVNLSVARDSLRSLPRIQLLKRRLDVIKNNTDNIVESMLKKISDDEGIKLSRVADDNRLLTGNLANSALNLYNRSFNRISLRGTIPLKEAIKNEAQRNFDTRMKVTYRDGRNVGYKEYMEMSTRTTLQQEIGASQLDAGERAGVVFYITNHFKDCADDHADYQGKIYYDERYKSFGYDNAEIEAIIRSKRMLGVQTVRDGKPWLTTRPNCRHTFTPISIDQARGGAKKLVDDLKISTGSYRDKNYQDTQKQRYNERQIRFYKARMEQNEALSSVLGDNTMADTVQRDKVLVSKWQARQRALIDKNPTLGRDYYRESLELQR